MYLKEKLVKGSLDSPNKVINSTIYRLDGADG